MNSKAPSGPSWPSTVVGGLALALLCVWGGYQLGARGGDAGGSDGPTPAAAPERTPTAADVEAALGGGAGGRRGNLTLDTAQLARFADALRDSPATEPKVERRWPVEIGRDGPEEWPDRVARWFAECDTGLEVVSTDCSEFPCLSTLRGDQWKPGLVIKLDDVFGDCPALDADRPDSEHALLIDYEVDCPDGATETMLVFATGDVDALVEAYPEVPREGEANSLSGHEIISRLVHDVGRRSDGLLGTWPCNSPE